MNIKIPAELLVIRLQKWVNENNRNGRIDTQELLDVLEVKTGIRADSIFAIFRMEQKTVMFATADKLMCAMHMQQQWYWPDLLPYYELLVPPICPVCLEPLEAPVHRGSPRVYCSKACKHLASDRRWRKRHPERARQISRETMRTWRASHYDKTQTPEYKAERAQYMREYRARQKAVV